MRAETTCAKPHTLLDFYFFFPFVTFAPTIEQPWTAIKPSKGTSTTKVTITVTVTITITTTVTVTSHRATRQPISFGKQEDKGWRGKHTTIGKQDTRTHLPM